MNSGVRGLTIEDDEEFLEWPPSFHRIGLGVDVAVAPEDVRLARPVTVD